MNRTLGWAIFAIPLMAVWFSAYVGSGYFGIQDPYRTILNIGVSFLLGIAAAIARDTWL